MVVRVSLSTAARKEAAPLFAAMHRLLPVLIIAAFKHPAGSVKQDADCSHSPRKSSPQATERMVGLKISEQEKGKKFAAGWLNISLNLRHVTNRMVVWPENLSSGGLSTRSLSGLDWQSREALTQCQ
jgi:hypothetical protein